MVILSFKIPDMATKKEKANDPQEEKKGELIVPTPLPEGASEEKVSTNENPSVEEVTESENKEKKKWTICKSFRRWYRKSI